MRKITLLDYVIQIGLVPMTFGAWQYAFNNLLWSNIAMTLMGILIIVKLYFDNKEIKKNNQKVS